MRGKLINHGSSVARGRKPGNQKEGGGGGGLGKRGKPPNCAAAGDVVGGVFGGEWRSLSAADQMKSW